MSEFKARLRSVRMKNGGASVHVLHTPLNEEGENLQGDLRRDAKTISNYSEPGSELDGFVIIGLFSDGKTSVSCRFPQRIPINLIPAYVGETMRREVIVRREAADEFDRRFEWIE